MTTECPCATCAKEISDIKKANEKDVRIQTVMELQAKCVNQHANAKMVIEWMNDSKRKPAITAFTEGPDRQIAYAFEMKIERYEKALNKLKNHSYWAYHHDTCYKFLTRDPLSDCMCGHKSSMEIIDSALSDSDKEVK